MVVVSTRRNLTTGGGGRDRTRASKSEELLDICEADWTRWRQTQERPRREAGQRRVEGGKEVDRQSKVGKRCEERAEADVGSGAGTALEGGQGGRGCRKLRNKVSERNGARREQT